MEPPLPRNCFLLSGVQLMICAVSMLTLLFVPGSLPMGSIACFSALAAVSLVLRLITDQKLGGALKRASCCVVLRLSIILFFLLVCWARYREGVDLLTLAVLFIPAHIALFTLWDTVNVLRCKTCKF